MEFDDELKYLSDDYEHLDPSLHYCVTRIPGKDAPESLFRYFENGCGCLNSECTLQNNCSCLKYGVNYKLTETGLILSNDKFGSNPVFECNFNCSCFTSVKYFNMNSQLNILNTPSLCPNRNVQFGPINGLEIFNANIKGFGLKTNRKILEGSYICEYAGEVISLEEAKKRQRLQSLTQKMNFIFILKEFSGEKLCCVTCIDPTYIGNIGRYINHSCQPNSVIVPVRVNDAVPRLCVFASKNIEKNEEISYDYSGNSLYNKSLENNDYRKLCYCGASSCKKFLPFEVEV